MYSTRYGMAFIAEPLKIKRGVVQKDVPIYFSSKKRVHRRKPSGFTEVNLSSLIMDLFQRRSGTTNANGELSFGAKLQYKDAAEVLEGEPKFCLILK